MTWETKRGGDADGSGGKGVMQSGNMICRFTCSEKRCSGKDKSQGEDGNGERRNRQRAQQPRAQQRKNPALHAYRSNQICCSDFWCRAWHSFASW
mmetsp:Transcript_1539/g.4732  ORF Transcript_1539/g.4732 Transcript_1539/m.4732 type:complete len:95 (+) Transcript_1539:2653-2937(+)